MSQLNKSIDLRFVSLSRPRTWTDVFKECKHLDNMNLRRLMKDHKDVCLILFPAVKNLHLVANHDHLQRGIGYEINLYMRSSLTGRGYLQERERSMVRRVLWSISKFAESLRQRVEINVLYEHQ